LKESNIMPSTLTRPAPLKAIDPGRTFSKAAIAELSPAEIRRMTHEELVRAIRTAQMSFLRNDELEHLQYLDRLTLERLAYLARRTCRNQGY
jgi:hypothetical protein